MLNTYTIGRIGKDCQVISGKHGSFVALDMAVDDYQKGESTTTWVRVKSSKENHIKLSEYLTKGRLILVHGTLSSSIWEDKNGNSHLQLSIVAETIKFIHTGKKGTEANAASETDGNMDKEAKAPMPPEGLPQNNDEDLPF